MTIRNLEFLFNPRRIAVIGANEDPGSLGFTAFRNLISEGFRGVVYPVTPRNEAIQGIEAYPSITDIPRDIDLAVLAVPCGEMLPALEACGNKGVKGVIIPCPDFQFRVPEAAKIQESIRALSRTYGFRVLGPNTLGLIRPSIKLNASLFPRMPQPGNIAFVSQSSTLATALLERAVSKNVGFSTFISLGATLDIGFAEMIDYLGVDAETRAIILYVEAIPNGRRFMTAARSFACSKPIVVVKSGKSALSAQVALTHTGLLAGEDKVYDAAFKRAGVLRVDELLDLFYLAETLSKQRRPKGKRLAIVSNSGGPAVIAVDTLLKLGGELGGFSPEIALSLEGIMPYGGISNPIDLLSDATPTVYEKAVQGCLKDKEMDGVLVILTPALGARPTETAEKVAATAKAFPYKPVFTTWLGVDQVAAAREILNRAGIPTFVTPEQAVRAFIYTYRYDLNLRLLLETPEAILKDFQPNRRRAEETLQKASASKRLVLSFDEVKDVLLAYGIPVVKTFQVGSAEEAVQRAEEIGYPVVLKIDSPRIYRKLKKGCVRLNLNDRAAVEAAFTALKEVAADNEAPDAPILVQPVVLKQGYEFVYAAKKDKTFGSVIIFGTGGELLEALEDYSVGLPPLNQTLARRVMLETKMFTYLTEQPRYRAAIRRLEEVMLRLSQLVIDFPQIREIDINPFFITEDEGFVFNGGLLLEENILEGLMTFKGEFCPPHLSICPYPAHFSSEMTLRDGTVATIRPVRPEDEPLIEELFKTFSEDSFRMRFFQVLIELRHDQLVRYCQIDYERELAFICVIKEGDRERIIGDVRIIRQADGENAEMAVMVGDPWQGQGVGKGLCSYCIEVARGMGVKRIWMEILRINQYMLSLSTRLGFRRVHQDDESVRVVLDLEAKAETEKPNA